MAYKKEDLIKQALQAIKKHKLIFIEEVVSFLPCSVATFYNYKLEELETIKSEIQANKINIKTKLRTRWQDVDNSALNIALYKLCATKEELSILSVQQQKDKEPATNENKGKTVEELEKELQKLGFSRTDKESY
jgi:hypothetical protein